MLLSFHSGEMLDKNPDDFDMCVKNHFLFCLTQNKNKSPCDKSKYIAYAKRDLHIFINHLLSGIFIGNGRLV